MKNNSLDLTDTSCAICNSDSDYKVLYPQNFLDTDLNVDTFSARRMPDRIHYRIVQCNQCNLVRSTPIVTDLVIETLYKKSKFTYQEETDNLVETYLESLGPVMQSLPKSANILEIGCGNGFMLTELTRQGYVNTYGVEPSKEAYLSANKKIKKHIVNQVLKPGLFSDTFFDCIFCFQTLDHIQHPNEFLKICFNLLKPGGYFVAFNHDIESLSAKILGEMSPIIDIEHTYLYSKKTVSVLLEKNGFSILHLSSPANYLSLKHLIWLTPISKPIKLQLIKLLLLNRLKLKLKLGNLCVVAQKT